MVNFRRIKIQGGTYFFTVTLRDRHLTLLTDYSDILKNAMQRVAEKLPYQTNAIVVLPEHLHVLWTLPEGDANYDTRWRLIKTIFTQKLKLLGLKLEKDRRGEYQIWQRRYWEHTIRNETDFLEHINYIHYNPVKHGWVKQVSDWPYSSFHRYVQKGLLEKSLGRDVVNTRGEFFGE